MEKEIENVREITITNLIHEPFTTRLAEEYVIIWDVKCWVSKIPPKFHIIETDEKLENYENISFIWNKTKFTLQEIYIHKEEGIRKMLDCVTWSQRYL